jgi:hypothetical protein
MVELMIALAIVAFAIVAAAKISSSAVRSSRRGTETVDIGQHARLISRQLRVDLRLAGEGSTGAIGVDSTTFWNNFSGTFSSGGYNMMPAVTGANNITAGTSIASGAVVTPNWVTDAIQLVVPDPATRVQIVDPYRAGMGAPSLNLAPLQTFPTTCPGGLVYIVDHGAANGAGKTQLAIHGGACTGCVKINDTTIFNIAPGAEVMCARISTYFVGVPAAGNTTVPWLLRSDIDPATTPVAVSGAAGTVNVSGSGGPGAWMDAPGVYDLQIAYAFSSELSGMARGVTPTSPAGRWAYAPGGTADPNSTSSGWFEVREIRFDMLVASVRAITDINGVTTTLPEMAAEDGAQIPMPPEQGRFRLSAGESLMTLRLFDKALPQGVPATPY